MEREAFEKFVRNKWDALGVGVVKRNEAGKYAATNIETMWETWQAALATQPLPVQEGGAKKAADAYLLSPRERGVFEHAFERGWDARGEAMTKCEESLSQPPLPVQRQPMTDAQAERLYRNISPTQQQDVKSLEAFKRLLRVIEAAHNIGAKP